MMIGACQCSALFDCSLIILFGSPEPPKHAHRIKRGICPAWFKGQASLALKQLIRSTSHPLTSFTITKTTAQPASPNAPATVRTNAPAPSATAVLNAGADDTHVTSDEWHGTPYPATKVGRSRQVRPFAFDLTKRFYL